MKLSLVDGPVVSVVFVLAVFNSHVFSFYLKKVYPPTWTMPISNVRMIPLVIADAKQEARLRHLASAAKLAKQSSLSAWEQAIEDRVCRPYNPTLKEIKIVE